jgi:SAM-dependent methyltransferase
MLEGLKRAYLRSQFFPGVMGIFANPFYFARKGLLGNIHACAGHMRGKILDVGCGQKPYRELFPGSEYIGLEIDTPENRAAKAADFFYDGKAFPFADAEFDSVLTNQVLEHVFNPGEFLGEIHRVLAPGGNLLVTVPFAWDEHEQPWDYARYSSFGLRHLLESNGFDVVESRKSVSDAGAVFQLWNVYLYKICPWRGNVGRAVYGLAVIAPFTLLGAVCSRLLPANPDLYLDNVVVAKKPR